MDLPQIDSASNQIRLGERLAVTFHRTLRVPFDGKRYPLPAGLGTFPVYRLADLDIESQSYGCGENQAVVPVHLHEALWIGIHAAAWKPNALKVAVGGINAVSGRADTPELTADPQDYLVCPPQLWLDGVNTGAATVRQFVATSLGNGQTIESSLTGTEDLGGLQLGAYEPNPGVFPDGPPKVEEPGEMGAMRGLGRGSMGVAAGGEIVQKIYQDSHGITTWNQRDRTTVFVHLLEANEFASLTSSPVPPSPISRETYDELGIPWYSLSDESLDDLEGSDLLGDLPKFDE